MAAVDESVGDMPVVTYGMATPQRHNAVEIHLPTLRGALLDHLAGHGHTRIGWLGHLMDWDELVGRGLELPNATRACLDVWSVRPPDEREADGRERAAVSLVRRRRAADPDRRPTAFLYNNDNAAMHLLTAFREAGVRVPEDVSVTGMNNMAESRHFSPALTTADLRAEALGEVLPSGCRPTSASPGHTLRSSAGRRRSCLAKASPRRRIRDIRARDRVPGPPLTQAIKPPERGSPFHSTGRCLRPTPQEAIPTRSFPRLFLCSAAPVALALAVSTSPGQRPST